MADYNINAIARKVSYTGSAGVGPYAFSFEVLDQTDVAVYKNATLLTLTTDYTVTVNANGTGSVTLVVAATAADTIVILGARDIERTTDFVTAGDLRASSLNEQLDSLTIFDQQIDERVERSIRAPAYDPTGINMVLPSKAARVDKLLKFDTEGNIEVAGALDVFGGALIGANYTNNAFSGDGSQTEYTLTAAPGSKNNIQIYIDGVYQEKATFSLTGSTLTFTEAPPLNASIECTFGEPIISGSTEATSIDYTIVATGGVERTLQTKLEEFVSVKDFGAVGDGVTDDTTAIQACFDAVDATEDGAIIYFPPGDYVVSDTLSLPFPGHTSLQGFGAQILSSVAEDTSGHGKPTFAFQGSGKTGSIEFAGFYFDGTNAGTNGDCIWANPKGSSFIIRNCTFEKFRHHFVHVDPFVAGASPQGANLHISDCAFREATDTAVIHTRIDAGTIRNCVFKTNEGRGIEVGQNTGSNRSFLGSTLTGESSSTIIDGCLIEDCYQGGVRAFDARSLVINADFELCGNVVTTLTSVSGNFTIGEELNFSTAGNGLGRVIGWDSGTSTLTIARFGGFNTTETITGVDSGATGTCDTKVAGDFQLDLTNLNNAGGAILSKVGPACKFSGELPHIKAREGCRIQADIKETFTEGCPGIVNPQRKTIVDARGTSFGDNSNRFGDGTINNGTHAGAVLVDDSFATFHFIDVTPPINATGVDISTSFKMDNAVFIALNGSIIDNTTDDPSAQARFYVRNVTDGSRLADFIQDQFWEPVVAGSNEVVPFQFINDSADDSGFDAGDVYRVYLRQPSGTANALTGHITCVLAYYKS